MTLWPDRLLTAFMSLLAFLLLVLAWTEPPFAAWISSRTAAGLLLGGSPLIAVIALAPGFDRGSLALTRALAAALFVTGIVAWAASPDPAPTSVGLCGLGLALWIGRGIRRRPRPPERELDGPSS